MPFVDPEDAATLLANVRGATADLTTAPGANGATARGTEAYATLVAWLLSERDAGTSFQDIQEAASRIAGSFIASTALSIARHPMGPELATSIGNRALSVAEAMVEPGLNRFTAAVREGRRQ